MINTVAIFIAQTSPYFNEFMTAIIKEVAK